MTVTINDQVADIFLGHPDLNSGDPYGFLLWKREKPVDQELEEKETAALSIQIDVNQDADPISMDKAFFLPILLKDHSYFTGKIFTEEETRENLYNLLGKGTRLFLQTSQGTYSGLEADGFVITETQYENYAIAQVRLSAENAVFLPVPNDRFNASKWLGPDLEDEFILKDESYIKVNWYAVTPGRYLTKFLADFPTGEGRVEWISGVVHDKFTAEFDLFFPENTLLGAGDQATISQVAVSGVFAEIRLKNDGGVFKVALVFTGGTTSFYTVPTDDCIIKYSCEMSSDGIATDGEAKLYIDGVLKETVSNLTIFHANGWAIYYTGAVSGGPPSTGKLTIGDIKYSTSLDTVWELDYDYPVTNTSSWGPDNDTLAYWR
jgi:hypothetical protein